MTRKHGGGYRAPGNYDPRQASKGRRALGGRPARQGDPKRADGSDQTRDSSSRASGPRKTDPRKPEFRGSDSRKPDSRNPESRKPEPRKSESRPARARADLVVPPMLQGAQRTRADAVTGISFAELGLGGNIVRALGELGATAPFAVQAVTIPDMLAGHNVLGRARTGSGKTIAFGAGLVERLLMLKAEGVFPPDPKREKRERGVATSSLRHVQPRKPKALIIAPTRELALQIDRTIQPIARSVGLYTAQLVGGQPFEPQLYALRRGIDIIIGTPGRIEDMMARDHLNLSEVAVTVIDEADHMSELGFLEQVQHILRRTRRGGQRFLFSATLDQGVDQLVREFMPQPAIHEVLESTEADDGSGRYTPPENVEHRVCVVARDQKDDALMQLVKAGGRTIVFCRTKLAVEHILAQFEEAGLSVTALHGDIVQAKRERNLERFTEGKATVLVATDVAARGIHVDDVDLVLQADPPNDPKAYVHRAGRTGRVGRPGVVITLIPRNRHTRTLELFEQLGFTPDSFADFTPNSAKSAKPKSSKSVNSGKPVRKKR